MITVIQGCKGFNKPKYSTLESIIESIRNCGLQPKLDAIRAETDKKKKRALKEALPSIMFSGKFSARGDSNCTLHSGLCCIDFDHLENLNEKKEEVKKIPFVVAAFISPSGDGLKVVCRIPADEKKHKGHYLALLKYFNQKEVDETCKNVERLCFGSADADIYFNPLADTFTEFIDETKPKFIAPITNKSWTDYSKINNAVKMIRDAADGQKHGVLLKAAKLAGGYISGGIVDEFEAVRILESAIQGKGIDNFKAAQQTIKDGIAYGKTQPIVELEREIFTKQVPTRVNLYDEDYDFVASDADTELYLNSVRDGSFKMGLTTGIPSLDVYFRFKRGNLDIINGADNVGKSTVIWYLMLLASINHKWRWIVLANENSAGYVKRKLIEFYCCQELRLISEEKYKEANKFVSEYFTIIKSEELYNYKDVMNMALKLMKKKQYDGMLIDPYNSLKIELTDSSKLSTHEYHYEVASELRSFGKKHDILIFLNCHVVTNALRQKDSNGHQQAPTKADTEGGGKFANKADEFITIHRLTQHKTDWMISQLHIRKVKENETGGKQTPIDEPFTLKMLKGSCGFEDATGFNPMIKVYSQPEMPLKPNISFDTEPPSRIAEPREEKAAEKFDYADPNLPF